MRAAARLARAPAYFWSTRSEAIARLQAQGMEIIRLDVGNPDFPPSTEIIEALNQAIRRPDMHGYPSMNGLPELRQAIAGYYARRFGVSLDPDKEILPLLGSKEGITHITLAFVDPGDLVIIPEPAYTTYRQGTYMAGGEVYVLPLLPENDYLPVLHSIPDEIARRSKILWLNYPHNPTGAIAPLELFAEAVEFARKYDLLLCHDAPYCDVSYEGYRPSSLLQVPGAKEVSLEFNSLSKTYNMAGWRVAMAVGSAEAIRELRRAKANTDSGIFMAIQKAATVALNGDQSWIGSRNAIYQQRRDLIVEACQAAGLSPRKPLAGLYVWAKVPDGWSSSAFSAALLERTGVSVVPGDFYGQGGEGYIRISVTAPTSQVEKAMERLLAFQRENKPI